MRHPGKYTFSKNPCPFRSLWASAAVIWASTEFTSGVRWELMDIDLPSSKSPFPDRCCQASNMTWLSGLLPTLGYSVHLSSQTASPPVIWFSPPLSPLPIFSQSIQTNSFNLCIRLIWNASRTQNVPRMALADPVGNVIYQEFKSTAPFSPAHIYGIAIDSGHEC